MSEQYEQTIARIKWSIIAEPGDAAVNAAIAAYQGDAAAALDALKRHIDGGDADLVSALGATLEYEQDVIDALDKWTPRTQNLDDAAQRVGALMTRFQMRTVIPGDDHWQGRLDDLAEHAPVILFTRGDQSLLTDDKQIAIVGARAATGYGEHVTMEAAAGLSDRGFTIISGGAYGIDGMAHRATLASKGRTIAFLAGGLDRYYPSGHDALLTRVAETGLVVGEMPPGTAPTKWRFLQRNRLIAAQAQATVVIEAGWRSGSLNTAGHASTLDRPLGAVPGPVTSAASAGCHRLIRDFGATLVTNADEMAELANGGHEQ